MPTSMSILLLAVLAFPLIVANEIEIKKIELSIGLYLEETGNKKNMNGTS